MKTWHALSAAVASALTAGGLALPSNDWAHLRHWLAYIFNPVATGPNIGAWVYCGILAAAGSYLLWPRVRKAANAWVHGHLQAHLAPLHDKIDALHTKVDAQRPPEAP